MGGHDEMFLLATIHYECKTYKNFSTGTKVNELFIIHTYYNSTQTKILIYLSTYLFIYTILMAVNAEWTSLARHL